MSKIGLLLDSTSMTRFDLNEYDFIKFVQLKVQVDHETYDESQLTSSQMEQYINDGKRFLTSQPSPAEFLDVFEQFHNEGYTHVMVVMLSHKLSGTYQSALIAKSMTNYEMEIDVHSPKTASFGLALGSKQLAETIKSGADMEAINARYHSIFQDPLVTFTLGDLTHLFHGGRLNRIQTFIGKILRIKLVIEMIDGKLELVEKKRKNIDCLDYFTDKIKSYVSKYKKVYLDIINLNMEDWSDKVLDFVKENFKNVDIHLTNFVSPVFYSHLGNKGFGIAIVAE